MGAVAFDLNKDEIKYRDYGLHNVEEIRQVAYMIDQIYHSRNNGSGAASSLYLDFLDLINKIEDPKYIKTYHDIQVGIFAEQKLVQARLKGMPPEPFEGTAEEESAHYLGVSLSDFKRGLESNMESMSVVAYSQWQEHFEDYVNVHINRLIIPKTFPKWDKKLTLDQGKLVELDQLLKHVHPRHAYRKTFLPREIKELDMFKAGLTEKIKQVSELKKKYKEKDTALFNRYKDELKKLETMEIQINKDISLIKNIYGIKIGNQNKKGSTSFTSYTNAGEIASAHEHALDEQAHKQKEELETKYTLEKIKVLSEKILKPNQQILLQLYYVLGLKQREIAELTGVSQQAIDKKLKTIIKKLQQNF
ncbi:sigma-70 family RNA polymerase sigma factor [Bacillus sp. Marseille-P3800]|uniref:sigma-70 family RNA polymerase sigma factor n=1 Tax=Bacillus sp. Marseille-P3800 TaxID=2014782 RepID=UPI000C07BA5C|nr:sigma-70 family RNA polymerase sigma factor [Bacillus sp. Marseille-P3800]